MPAASIKQRIVDDITDQIRRGDLKAGDRLPTTPHLQEQYGAKSIVPVRAAISELKAVGVIEFVPGVGIFVK